MDGRKRRFSNTMTSCLGSRLALPHMRFERRRFFLNTEEKFSVFENTRLRVDGFSTLVLYHRQSNSDFIFNLYHSVSSVKATYFQLALIVTTGGLHYT